MCHISHRFIREVEDRIAGSLMVGIVGEDISLIVEIAMMAIEVMDAVEVILGEAILEEDIITEVDIIVIEKWIELGRTGEGGDNLDQEKEVEIVRVGHHLVLGRGRETQIEIGLGVLDVESMITLLMIVLIKPLMIQIRRVIAQDLYCCIWQIVIQDWI